MDEDEIIQVSFMGGMLIGAVSVAYGLVTIHGAIACFSLAILCSLGCSIYANQEGFEGKVKDAVMGGVFFGMMPFATTLVLGTAGLRIGGVAAIIMVMSALIISGLISILVLYAPLVANEWRLG